MTQDFEKQMAVAIKKAKLKKANFGKSTPLKKEHNLEKIEYNKQKLLSAAEKKDQKETVKYFNKLVELRAEQVIILLLDSENSYVSFDEKNMKTEVKRFYKECLELAMAIDKILENDKTE